MSYNHPIYLVSCGFISLPQSQAMPTAAPTAKPIHTRAGTSKQSVDKPAKSTGINISTLPRVLSLYFLLFTVTTSFNQSSFVSIFTLIRAS